ncbi:MAG: ATP synthase F1 subunit epsilon [Pseudomonadota bacterium]
MKTFGLTVLSPEKEIFKGEALSVSVPTLLGDIEVFPDHSANLSVLAPGYMAIHREGEDSLRYFVTGGYIDITKTVNVVADHVMSVDEVTSDYLLQEKANQEALLARSDKIDDKAFDRASDALARYNQMLEAV